MLCSLPFKGKLFMTRHIALQNVLEKYLLHLKHKRTLYTYGYECQQIEAFLGKFKFF